MAGVLRAIGRAGDRGLQLDRPQETIDSLGLSALAWQVPVYIGMAAVREYLCDTTCTVEELDIRYASLAMLHAAGQRLTFAIGSTMQGAGAVGSGR